MLKELYTAAMGMMPQQTKLEVTANNIANANTTGFKKESVFIRNLIDARAHFYNVQSDCEQNDPPVGSYTDFSAGSSKQTNNPLDMTVENKTGFFVVQDDNGQMFLTRSGHFTLLPDGSIADNDGRYLMGQTGRMNIGSEINDGNNFEETKNLNLRLTEGGELFANQKMAGILLIANVVNPDSLQRISNTSFITTETTELNFLAEDQAKLRQGWLEGSNVNVVNEMVSMIELQRLFELGSKVIRTNDDTIEQSIRIGRFY